MSRQPKSPKTARRRAGGSQSRKGGTSRAEWIAAGVAAVLLAAALIYLAVSGLMRGGGPPRIEVVSLGVARDGTEYLVRFRARNSGDRTAAQVVIAGELRQGDSTVEKSQVTLPYLPIEATRRGGLFFRHDPSAYQLSLRAEGFMVP